MASAWGQAWGQAWGNAWGTIADATPPDPETGGSGGSSNRKRGRLRVPRYGAQRVDVLDLPPIPGIEEEPAPAVVAKPAKKTPKPITIRSFEALPLPIPEPPKPIASTLVFDDLAAQYEERRQARADQKQEQSRLAEQERQRIRQQMLDDEAAFLLLM